MRGDHFLTHVVINERDSLMQAVKSCWQLEIACATNMVISKASWVGFKPCILKTLEDQIVVSGEKPPQVIAQVLGRQSWSGPKECAQFEFGQQISGMTVAQTVEEVRRVDYFQSRPMSKSSVEHDS